MLLQLFMDRRSAIKQQSYDTMLKLIAANQAKGGSSGLPIVQEMRLEDGDLPDADRVQEVVTYDIVPEIESYLHAIGKRLHSSLDENEEIAKQFTSGEARATDDADEDDEEEKKDSDDEEGEERGRTRKRDNGKKKKGAKPATAGDTAEGQAQDDKGDIFERIDAIYAQRAKCEKELDEANEQKSKYKIGIQVYDSFI